MSHPRLRNSGRCQIGHPRQGEVPSEPFLNDCTIYREGKLCYLSLGVTLSTISVWNVHRDVQCSSVRSTSNSRFAFCFDTGHVQCIALCAALTERMMELCWLGAAQLAARLCPKQRFRGLAIAAAFVVCGGMTHLFLWTADVVAR